jgi:hypothetical protein
VSKPDFCKNCGKVIKRDRFGSHTGWRHSSSGQVVCEPKGDAEPFVVDKPIRKQISK